MSYHIREPVRRRRTGAAEALTNPPSTNIASAFRSKAEPCALSFALHRRTPSTSLPSDRCPVHTIFPTAFTRNHRRLLRPHFGRTPGAAHQTHMSDHLAGSSEPPTKRRKVRKGTRSCWECKRPRSCPISTCPGGQVHLQLRPPEPPQTDTSSSARGCGTPYAEVRLRICTRDRRSTYRAVGPLVTSETSNLL